MALHLWLAGLFPIFGFMDINPNYNKTPLIFGLLISLATIAVSGFIFINSVEYYGTDKEWKFYCSLAGFSIFFLMFCFVLAGNIIAMKKTGK